MSTKLDKLLEKERQLREQIRLEQNKQKCQERKIDTRRKILVGALVLEWVRQGQWKEEDLLRALDGFLVREHDRALFGLSTPTATPAPEPEKPAASPEAAVSANKSVSTPRTVSTAVQAAVAARLPEPEPQGVLEEYFNL